MAPIRFEEGSIGEGGKMSNWFTSMFTGEAQEDDVIAGGTLNITKITALTVPIGTAAMAFLTSALDEKGPLALLTPGQRLVLFLAPVAVVAAVVLMDMWARATVTAGVVGAQSSAPLVRIKKPIEGEWSQPGQDKACSVVAIRSKFSSDGDDADFLIVVNGEGFKTVWISASDFVIK